MRLRTLVGRLGLPLVIAGLATVGAGLPAHADPGDPFEPEPASDVELVVPERVVAVDGKSKTVEVVIDNYGDVAATGLSLSFGSTPIPASVGFTPPEGCTVTGCDVGSVAAGKTKTVRFKVSPTADLPTFGATFDVVLKNDAGASQQSALVTVVKATEPGVDLELAPIDDFKLKAGATADVPLVFTNTGDKAPAGYGVVLIGDPFLQFPVRYSNCFDLGEEGMAGVACAFDEPIEPGETVTLAGKAPTTLKVAADAPGPSELFAGAYVMGLTEKELAELPVLLTGKAARASALEVKTLEDEDLEDGPQDLNDWDNARSFTVTVAKNLADTVALGGTFEGGVGDTRTVKVGMRNDGPAATRSLLQGWLLFAEVEMPTGVEISKVDPLCVKAEDRHYFCLTLDNLHKGDKAEFAFTGTIKAAGKAGSIKVDNGDQDSKKSNDTAVLDVKLATGGAGGGDDGPSLPVTGAPAGIVAGGGALLLVAGGAAFFAARRRRIVTVVE